MRFFFRMERFFEQIQQITQNQGRNRRSSQLRMTIGGVPMFQATILIDNDAEAGFCSEWGFSVYVEYNGRTYLLDTGSSDQYLTNARRMSIPVEEIVEKSDMKL